MDITMKLAEVVNLNIVLKKIIDDTSNKKMDALFKFKLLGILKSLEPSASNFELIRNEKIKEYGQKDENGNIKIDENDVKAIENVSNALNPILVSDVIVNIEKLKIKDVFDKGVPSEYLIALYGIMEE